MKSLLKLTSVLILTTSFFLASCSKDDSYDFENNSNCFGCPKY